MPEWMHNRAEHILAKNPSMPKSEAFAIATQQSHALGKSPKGYGTAEGKATAKAKFDTPKDDKKTANPGGLTSEKMAGIGAQALAGGALGALIGHGHAKGQGKKHTGKSMLAGAALGAVGAPAVMAAAKHIDQRALSRAEGEVAKGNFEEARRVGNTRHFDPGIKIQEKMAFDAALLEEFAEINKVSGVLGDTWKAMNTPIPGTPTLVAGRGLLGEAAEAAKSIAPAAAKTKDQILAARRASWRPAPKLAFTVSQYSGPLSMGAFKMTSGLPNKAPPSLYESPVEVKKAEKAVPEFGGLVTHGGIPAPPLRSGVFSYFDRQLEKERAKKAGVMSPTGVTPAARLSSSMRIGAPKVTAPSGPSIAAIAKPKGFGTPIAGATLSQ